MSDHSVKIVPVVLEKHPNADTLSVVTIGGFTCVVRTADWEGKPTGAYCAPDTLVPVARPEFAFLAPKAYGPGHFAEGFTRIRAMKLRGVWSEGLLLPYPGEVGADVTEALGCSWYNPPEDYSGLTGGVDPDMESAAGYSGKLGKYDVENIKRYQHLLVPGEQVIATEKLHGANGRWRWDAEASRFWCGSRNNWKKEADHVLWWQALRNTPALGEFLKANPHLIVFGEAVGKVKGFPYHGVQAVAFDVFDTRNNSWWDKPTISYLGSSGVPTVPVLYQGPFDLTALTELAEGKSVYAPAGALCREGVVVSPMVEREDMHLGRVILKLVGRGFLEKS